MSGSPTWREIDAIRTGKSDIDLAERIWQLERQLAEALVDAERYRWLQSQGCDNAYGKVGTDEDCYLQLNPRDMDAAIDAARSRSEESK